MSPLKSTSEELAIHQSESPIESGKQPDSVQMKRCGFVRKQDRTKREDEVRWGLILAGGDGERLRNLTRVISGDDRPKQFCKIIGDHTLLEQTWCRAARSIPSERTILTLTASHRRFYEPDIDFGPSLRLVQPCNRGTAPAILLGVLHIAQREPNALVAILPSDHYYSNDAAFAASLDHAFKVAGLHRDSVVLLGAQATGPEVDFGWIDLGQKVGENLFGVRRFVEKPAIHFADRLFRSGALWNTFVMVGRAMAFLWMAFVNLPGLLGKLQDALQSAQAGSELQVPDLAYKSLYAMDFSGDVLSLSAHRLLALRMRQTEWHDLGHPERVVSVLRSKRAGAPSRIRMWEGALAAQERRQDV